MKRAASRAARGDAAAASGATPPAPARPRATAGTAAGSGTGTPGLPSATAAGYPPGGTAPVMRPERVVARVRSHARRLIPSALLLIAVVGATTYAVGVFDDPWVRLGILVAAVLVLLVGCVLPLIAWLARRTTITTRRVVLRHGVFSRVRQELLNSRATDVDVRAGWIASMFGSGDVRINTAHDRTFVLQDVPRPELVQAALQELMDPSSPAAIEHRRAVRAGLDGDTVAWHRR
ncbi:PH domain-containing protein [Agromyces sp. CF514]|uniref:PH domain-containing protein n=1 Tax=Agromyces sp. CF514 TaxID=1881031 RepID=UPI001160D899|nr:PH domain-containing protein [Agromyces sp. CF514]